jgi:GH24 family phage-related lysozyme (muramidase)
MATLRAEPVAIIPNENYVAFYNPRERHHRDWLLAVLDHLTTVDPKALSEGPLRDLWTQGGVTAEVSAEDVALALPLIREFEGLHLEAYPDPKTGGKPWTIGWGSTRLADNREVQPGDKITQREADTLLQMRVNADREVMAGRIPTWGQMSAPQRAALLSFAYNLGSHWYDGKGFATLTKAVREANWGAVPAALELYRNPGSNVEAGLLRRRRAEGRMFASGTTAAAPAPAALVAVYPNPLQVYPYRQLDSETDQARRMCFSSSNAMLVEYLKPGTLKGPNGDDQYLRTVKRFGDTTSIQAQMRALASYGIKARFIENAKPETLEQQISRGIPVPCGYIHRGPVDRPTGGGHWLTVIGFAGTELIVHDPLGRPDLQNGTTLNTNGIGIRLPRQLFFRRWEVEPIGGGAFRYAPGRGWAIIAER